MEHRKFIQLHNTLTINQKKDFVNYLILQKESKPQEIAIARALLNTKIDTIELLQEAIQENNVEISAHRFEKLFNPLKRFLEDFIVENSIKLDYNSIDRQIALMEYYDENKLFTHLTGAIQKGEKLKSEIQLASEFRSMYRFERMVEIIDKRNLGANLVDRSLVYQDLLNQAYLIDRIRISIEHLNRERIIKGAKKEGVEDLSIYKQYIPSNLLIEIYVEIYQAIRDSSITAIKLNELLLTYQRIKTIPAAFEDNQTIGLLFINFCIVAIRRQGKEFYPLFIKIVECLESKNALVERNTIEGDLFKIIITTAVKFDLQWGKGFFEKYKKQVIPYNGEDIVAYAKSLIEFAEGNYGKAHETLVAIKTSNYNDYMKLNLKKQLIKCLVETNWENRLENSNIMHNLSNMTKMISRSSIITVDQKSQFSNFVKYVAYILKRRDQKDIEKKKVEIFELSFIQEREWVVSLYNRK